MSEISENLSSMLKGIREEYARLKAQAEAAKKNLEDFVAEVKDVCGQAVAISQLEGETQTNKVSERINSSKNNVHPITSYCDKHEWSANDFAGHFGVAYASVRRWEAGETVTPRSLEKIKAEDKRLAKAIIEHQIQKKD